MRWRNLGASLVVFVFLMGTPAMTEAGWDLPISPGDHVFDAKRFADSIRETAEVVKEVTNTIEIIGNHLKMLAKAGDIEGMWQALKEVGNLPLGKTADQYTELYRTSRERAESHEPYWPILHESLAKSNEDTGKAAEAVFLHQEERNSARLELLEARDDSLLSERQRQNMESILSAMDAIDQSELLGNRFMQIIEAQEAEFSSQRIEQEKAKSGAFYGYDPYHPNDYDKEHRTVKTHNIGFMGYGSR